jgi:uncharacterized protein (TIGR02594 family)
MRAAAPVSPSDLSSPTTFTTHVATKIEEPWSMHAFPNDQPWLKRAIADLGLHELPGAAARPRIIEMYAKAGHPEITSDEVAWCSAALNTWMVEANIRGTGSLAARSWLAWGRAVDIRKVIPRGAVLIFRREDSSWQGHVCLCLEDRDGIVTVIGGNQSDAVTIARYRKAALIGARWPDTVGNSRTIQSLIGSGLAETAERGAGQAAEHIEVNSDRVAEALGAAQQQATQLASHLRIAQYPLIALAVAGLLYAIYRFVWRHLKPRSLPQASEDGPSIEEAVVDMTAGPVPARNKKRRSR